VRRLRSSDLGHRPNHHTSLQAATDRLVLGRVSDGTHSNGISALQLQRQLAFGSYKTAWLICAKLRCSMLAPGRSPLAGLVEVDETEIAYRRGYVVRDGSHRFMEGLTPGLEIGTEGWNITVGGASLKEGAASGWGVDRMNDASPSVVLLAEGNYAVDGDPGAQMTYFDHPGGGFVFCGMINWASRRITDEAGHERRQPLCSEVAATQARTFLQEIGRF
jgi:hypothetical protein